MKSIKAISLIAGVTLLLVGCKIPELVTREENNNVPEYYQQESDTLNSAEINWKEFFDDPYLSALIDSALTNNQELNIMMQEIEMSSAEVLSRKGEYLPFVDLGAAGEVEKVGRYTSQGANDANTEIEPGKEFPDPLPNFMLAANASWEVDIWHKLRNARDAAANRYLSTIEGRNFMVTNLVSEIATTYYELMGLDNKMTILKQNIEIQTNALEIVKLQKAAAKTTELAVKRFEAEVYKNRSHQFELQQQIIELENRINFLVGRFPQPVARATDVFQTQIPDSVYSGLPSQLLSNRPDIRAAELELTATKLDVKSARAEFYPSLRLTAVFGAQSFNPAYFARLPESMLYSMAGDLMAPLVNRKAIKAHYYSANARQIQAMYEYEQSILNGYIEVMNHLSKIQNLQQNFDLKTKQVDALTTSIGISTNLFKSARADYMEVLLTQREALESRFDLVETRVEQLSALIGLYKSLGGGWQ